MPFGREGSGLVAELDDFEVALVASLVGQVNELLGAGLDSGPAEDPFSRWEGGFSAASTLDHSDPVVGRLFPDAYADDPGASAEYRRYTEDDLRRTRIAEGELVLADLAATAEGRRPLVVPVDHAEAWVRTVNGVRLSLAVRLGIDDESDHARLERLPARDPRGQLLSLYDWLGYVLESLVEALDADA